MPGSTQEEFLKNIRYALGKIGPIKAPDYLPLKIKRKDQIKKIVTIEARVQFRRRELIEKLGEMASLNGWNVFRAASPEKLVDYVVALTNENKAKSIVRSNHEVFKRVSLDSAIRQHKGKLTTVAANRLISQATLREIMAHADIGITGVDYAIAETGTCVLVPRQGVSRMVSLLPPIHVAIVESNQVYETLDDIFALRRLAFLDGRGNTGRYLNFISGPSRTGDIEQTIITGVHGPVEVHMVIMDAIYS
ncbi:lactate utilization protein [Dehalococcoidia bacterium]|nr:lactate utilization protein [Dehalococcoidia bacterium]